MPAVKPPEWDAMSAREQLLWYLERLCAQADEMSSVLGIASASAPPVVTPLDPAASTTTHASLAPVPDVSDSTTKAQEVLEVSHDTPPTCIAMAHNTCSTDGSSQVVATNNINKVTTVYPEPAVYLDNKEVEHLTPAPATPSIGGDTCSITKEVVPPMAITTDIDPKAGVQELNALSVDTSTPVMSEADHDVALIIPSDTAPPVLTMCSTDGLVQDGEWVKPVHLVDKSNTSCLPSIQQGIGQQPWMSPVRVRNRQSRHLFRPRPWPSFKFHSDASYQEEPCSGILCQAHEVLWFSSEFVLRLFRDVVFHQVSSCEVIALEEYFSCLSVAQLQSRSPPDQAPPDTKALNELAFLSVDISASIGVDAWFNLRFLRTNCRPIDTAPHAGRWIYLDFSNMGCQGRQSYACSIVQLMAVAEYFAHWDIIYDFVQCHNVLFATGLEFCRVHTKALQIVDEFGSIFQMELCHHAGDLECNLPRHCIRIPSVQIFCLWSLQQNNGDSCFAKQLLQYPYLATMDAHLFHSRQKTGALSTKLSSSIFLQFMQLGPHELDCCIISFVQSPYDICARDVQLRFGFSQKHIQPKPPYSSGDCRTVRVWSELFKTELSDKFCSSVTKLCWLAVTYIHDLGSVEYIEDLFLFIYEQSRRLDTTGNLVCKTQEHWNLSEQHILEHAAVCSVPMGDKLQIKSQLISLSVHQKNLSQEDCKCVLLTLLSNEEAATSTVIQPVNSRFNGFASSWSMIPPAHEFSYMMSCATTDKWVVKFGAVLLGKLPCISFYLPSAQPKHPWPFPVATMCTQQLLFPMKTITGFVTILKIYSRLFEFGIAHLLGSKSASARHLEQSWDPGASDKTLPVQVSHPWEGITHCRIMFHDGQRVVDSMQFSSGCKQERFQGGNGPGFVSSSHLQPLTILVVKIISKGAPAISGMTFSTGYNQDHFQEGRGIIVVAAVFALGFVDHGYDLGFDHDGADNGYVLDGNSIHHNCCFNLVDVYSNFDYHQDSDYVHEHRVHWDLGGYQWCRLGVKPSFKKGGMLGALGPACVHGLPYDSTWARPGCAPP